MADRLPVPTVSKPEEVFPTGRHTPPWDTVPDEFKTGPSTWKTLASRLFYGRPPATEWHGIPHEGVDAEMAWKALLETMGNYGIKHERKIASTAYMLSQWFRDFWWDGDTHTHIFDFDLRNLIWFDEGTKVRTVKPDEESDGWSAEALVSRQWGIEGTVVCHHDSHGFTYEVEHPDGSIGTYEPRELEEIE